MIQGLILKKRLLHEIFQYFFDFEGVAESVHRYWDWESIHLPKNKLLQVDILSAVFSTL